MAKRRAENSLDDPATLSRADEDALMKEFASLSDRYEADQITPERYATERRRIFVELGIEEES